MKLIYTLLIAFTLTSNLSLSKDKKTIIDQIEEADSIPIFIIHGKVTPGKYNTEMQKIPLNSIEQKKKFVTGIIPSDIDTNHLTIVELLNLKFSTTKFYAATTGTEDEVTEYITTNKVGFFILAKFTAEYTYGASHARRDVQSKKIVAILDMWMRCHISFNVLVEKQKPIKRLSGPIAGRRTRIEMNGFINTADEFMAIKSPLTLTSGVLSNLDEKLSSYATKQKAKHEKATSKRNK